MVLDMIAWGGKDNIQENGLGLLPPPKASIAQSEKVLEAIEAIENGQITAHGKAIQTLPLQPRIAHMLLYAKRKWTVGISH